MYNIQDWILIKFKKKTTTNNYFEKQFQVCIRTNAPGESMLFVDKLTNCIDRNFHFWECQKCNQIATIGSDNNLKSYIKLESIWKNIYYKK